MFGAFQSRQSANTDPTARRAILQGNTVYKYLSTLTLKNAAGQISKWSATTNRWYCGRTFCENGRCPCGTCDGRCGPTNGCPCPECAQFVPKYCGRQFTLFHQCPCGTCDGVCGPTNGCPCPDCFQQHYLPYHIAADPERALLYPMDNIAKVHFVANKRTTVAVLCLQGHPLFYAKSTPPGYGSVCCDACQTLPDVALGFWHCPKCEHDLCGACFQAQASVKIVARTPCANGHCLQTLFSKPPKYIGNARCDLCKETFTNRYEDGFFHCGDCSYDVCQKCEKKVYQQKVESWPPDLQCPEGHPNMQLSFVSKTATTPGGSPMLCLSCETPIIIANGFGFCEQCDGSICLGCFRQLCRKRMQALTLVCRQGHPLLGSCVPPKEQASDIRNMCDNCNKPVICQRGYLRCKQCDFDLCFRCILNEQRARLDPNFDPTQTVGAVLRQGVVMRPPRTNVTSGAPPNTQQASPNGSNQSVSSVPTTVGPSDGVVTVMSPLTNVNSNNSANVGNCDNSTTNSPNGQTKGLNPQHCSPTADSNANNHSSNNVVSTPLTNNNNNSGISSVTTNSSERGFPDSTVKRFDALQGVASSNPLHVIHLVFEETETPFDVEGVGTLDDLRALICSKFFTADQHVDPGAVLFDQIDAGSPSPIYADSELLKFIQKSREAPAGQGPKLLVSLDHCVIGEWIKKEKLGRGSFGEVFLAENFDGTIFAVKIVTARKEDQEQRKAFQSEIRLMRQLKHPNLVDYFGALEKPEEERMEIYMEWLPGGTLKDHSRSTKLPLKAVRDYAKQLLQAIAFLHSFNIMHRDIKTENILLSADRRCLKLGDFGTAKHLTNSVTQTGNQKGTPLYMAPEIYTGSGKKCCLCDIWSYGCVLIELLTQNYPYSELGKIDNIFAFWFRCAQEKLRPKIPPDCSPSLKSLIECCLEWEPESRGRASDLLKHEFFKEKN